ncbi:MAG: 4-deoxy-4-formamido-L-arabinose-phosphoundecaprenol deformylase [Kiritimatiellae bacterium]|nr:4-deoxy-4-formamido-L-arabinose-phosphoundecaprenol deformylase [Verrucomicrobiota bacterium]MBU4365842.1 4-deoxy-4-formamido-L-arabinose-phosphoundecaprenol deformylase [Verrucomicrobiota bacterium]MCG2661509.1 4-deoxy-4-formamido-L-arabinose-phosphoundecaprenol deformylase [Kiritimatiellia bacterium]
MKIGLRIDVDTLRGTRDGVPALCRLLASCGIRATFFFSVGPDNMGRHLWRLVRPRFLVKMLRSHAAGLYGWDILLRGTCWPGTIIGKHLGDCLRLAEGAGHEMGFHAWDHYTWQAHIEHMPSEAIRAGLTRGVDLMTTIVGAPPTCSASPGWRCTEAALREKERFPFAFNSDCRGQTFFRPVVASVLLNQPQVPVTLPTFDEVIGRPGVTLSTYNDYILSLIQSGRLNVFTIHAEVEGIVCRDLFERFVQKARSLGHEFTPLGALLESTSVIPAGRMASGTIPGRDGWVAVQKAV